MGSDCTSSMSLLFSVCKTDVLMVDRALQISCLVYLNSSCVVCITFYNQLNSIKW